MRKDEFGLPRRRILVGNICVTDVLMALLFLAFAGWLNWSAIAKVFHWWG